VSTQFQEALGAARRDENPQALAEAIPYARFMGIEMRQQDGDILGTMHYRRDLIGNYVLPALHGGSIGALLESTSIFKLLWQDRTVTVPKTINITVQYLRSGKPEDTFARALITRHGRRIANVYATAWQKDEARPIATATGNYLLA